MNYPFDLRRARRTSRFTRVSLISALFAATLTITAWASATAQVSYQLQPDSLVQPGVPKGEMLQFDLTSKLYYPGSKTTIYVYVPKEYSPDKPACLYVGLDGAGFHVTTVLDNLIYKKQVPVTIGVFVPSSSIYQPGKSYGIRYDRCFEYDSTNDRFDKYLVNEVLPQVERLSTTDGRAIRISADPNDHMIAGASSGGICAFTAAWQHPDLFRRVFSAIGTYVGMRGGDMYPTLIRKTEPKPIRIFLQDGAADSWNALFDNWYTQNKSMEESLRFAGYDVEHNWGVLGHEGSHADSLFPSAMKWIWRDYPQPIAPGHSSNSMLNTILSPGEEWIALPNADNVSPRALTVDPSGHLYFTNGTTGDVYKVSQDGAPSIVVRTKSTISAISFAADGTLYVSQPNLGRIVKIEGSGKQSVIATNIKVTYMTLIDNGTVYASAPAPHDDMPSRIWRIGSKNQKSVVDSGLHNVSGIVVTGDHSLLFAAEGSTHWIYSYVLASDGSLTDKQRFYWLHTAESADDKGDDSAGATDITSDADGFIYAATKMGVQVCDRNGRVEGILTLPAGPITSLSFCGADFKTLAVVCDGKIYLRKLNATGLPAFAKPVTLPDFGGG
jgi:gluconolactonase